MKSANCLRGSWCDTCSTRLAGFWQYRKRSWLHKVGTFGRDRVRQDASTRRRYGATLFLTSPLAHAFVLLTFGQSSLNNFLAECLRSPITRAVGGVYGNSCCLRKFLTKCHWFLSGCAQTMTRPADRKDGRIS